MLTSQILFDIKHRTNTFLPRWPQTLEENCANKKYAIAYDAVDSRIFHIIFQKLKRDLTNSIFIDFGCGKGKALMLASQHFNQLIGIEFSNELCKICRKNVGKFLKHQKLKCKIEIVHSDAADYIIPEEADIFFLYNPFWGEALETVVKNINNSILHNPREVLIIYVNGVHKHIFEREKYHLLFRIDEKDDKYNLYPYGVYVFKKNKI